MQFLAGGPSIPDDLLVARDEGRVVFFCGAGVSRARAGLDDFFGLARKVIEKLGVTANGPARKLIAEIEKIVSRPEMGGLISVDSVFRLLDREFRVQDIQAKVAEALKPSTDVDLSAHRIMLELARSPDGKVRIVTTNFDLLFEKCDESLPSSRPPQLPDPLRSEEFEGIIHLHGCVDSEYRGAAGDGFVLSSAGFGQAYLSHGWATTFIRKVLQRYVVVFVGYTADDPPVQYLLEALNLDLGSFAGAYAFQEGSVGEAKAKWKHKGVCPLAYDNAEEHKALWDTLAAWASRAQDSVVWHESLIALARKGPEALLPHERGQIAHIVSTLEGARQFATSTEPPPAEWLCVFAPAIRYAKPGHLRQWDEEGAYFDPFDAYGIDADPPPPKIEPDDFSTQREIPDKVWDCFTFTSSDRRSLRDHHLAAFRGHWATNVAQLPDRLLSIGVWIRKVSHQPAAVWWAAMQVGIHHNLQEQILIELRRTTENYSPEVRQAWQYLFEAWEEQQSHLRRTRYQLKDAIDVHGWTNTTIREYAFLSRPYLKVSKPLWGGPKPPNGERPIRRAEMLALDVEYPEFRGDMPIPDEFLLPAIREFRKNLEHAVSLEKELESWGLHTLGPIELDPGVNGDTYGRDRGILGAVLFYVDLFKRLIDLDSTGAKQECAAWWMDDDTVFARLRIWVLRDHRIVSGSEAGHLICGLSEDPFWDDYHQRDLLLLLQERWSDFSATAKQQIEGRLLQGRPRWPNEEQDHYEEERARLSLNRIQWLQDHSCQFTFAGPEKIAELRKHAPDWQEHYAAKAAASREGSSRSGGTDRTSSDLLRVPLDAVVSKAGELRGRTDRRPVERDPFAGLVSERPVRALAALTQCTKRKDYPEWAWRTFLYTDARKSDKPKFAALIAERVTQLPANAVADIISPISKWLLNSSERLLSHYPQQFQRVWEKVLPLLRSDQKIIRPPRIRGRHERDWAREALTAPVGYLAQALLNDPQSKSLATGTGFPSLWIRRVEELLSLDGDLHRHALVFCTRHLEWFFAIDPGWTEKNLLFKLDEEGDDQNAFWAGFFWAAQTLTPVLYMQLKPHLLKFAPRKSPRQREDGGRLAAILLAGWATVSLETGERYVTSRELREVLVGANDDFRSHALWQIERWLAEEKDGRWANQVFAFLTEVWPRHLHVKSPGVSARLCNLAFASVDLFPKIVDVVVSLVTVIEYEHFVASNLGRAKDEIVVQYPKQTLALLFAILSTNTSVWPYDIGEILGRIGDVNPSLRSDSRFIELKRRGR